MSIEQTDQVDVMSVDGKAGDPVLTVSDHLEWTGTVWFQKILQAKLNKYLSFVESGEILGAPVSQTEKTRRVPDPRTVRVGLGPDSVVLSPRAHTVRTVPSSLTIPLDILVNPPNHLLLQCERLDWLL